MSNSDIITIAKRNNNAVCIPITNTLGKNYKSART